MDKDNKQIIVGLDLGSMNIDVVIGVVQEDGTLKIIGLGTSPSEGIRKGVIYNIDHAAKAIRKAVDEAENMAGFDVREAYVGVSGKSIKSLLDRGALHHKQPKLFTKQDMQSVVEQAASMNMPTDRFILHDIPQGFSVDGQEDIKDPVGSFGIRLESKVISISSALSTIENIRKVMDTAEIEIAGFVLSSLASSYAVANQDEKELGVAIVDVGAAVTDIAVYVNEHMHYARCIDLGGENVTSDVGHAITAAKDKAEDIKRKHGACKITSLMKDEFVEVPPLADRQEFNQVSKEFLVKVIRARMYEIFDLVSKDLQRNRLYDKLGGGIVITGGGVLMSGTLELAREVFNAPFANNTNTRISVRIGRSQSVAGLSELVENPAHATGVGIVLYAHELIKHTGQRKTRRTKTINVKNSMSKFIGFIKNWI